MAAAYTGFWPANLVALEPTFRRFAFDVMLTHSLFHFARLRTAVLALILLAFLPVAALAFDLQAHRGGHCCQVMDEK